MDVESGPSCPVPPSNSTHVPSPFEVSQSEASSILPTPTSVNASSASPPNPPNNPSQSKNGLKGILSLLPPTVRLPPSTSTLSIPSSAPTITPTSLWVNSLSYIILYFSATWCRPCQHFSPKLANFVHSNRDEVGVMYVTHDTSEGEMEKGMLGKPYASFTSYGGRDMLECKGLLGQVLSVNMLPTCIVVDAKTGRRVTSWGRSCVERNGEKCLEEWKEGKEGVTYFQAMCNVS